MNRKSKMYKSPVFKSTELFDHRALRTIVENFESIDVLAYGEPGLKKMLTDYLSRGVPDASGVARIPVSYQYAVGQKNGRLFAAENMSQQRMYREVRQTIARDLYHDIDMVNAHPVILLQYCRKNNIPSPTLERYVADRDALLTELSSLSRDEAKRVVLAVLNGGTKDYENLRNSNSAPDWLTALKADMEVTHRAIWNDKRHEALVKSVTDAKETNLMGCLCNRVICVIEGQLLLSLVSYLKSVPALAGLVENAVLVYDGIMLPKRPNYSVDNSDFLTAAAAYMARETGYHVSLASKPMPGLDISQLKLANPRDVQVAKNDSEAGDMLLEIAKSFIRKCGSRMFCLNKRRVWTEDYRDVKDVMLKLCGKSNIMKIDDRHVLREYAGNGGAARHIIDFALTGVPETPDFVDVLWRASLGKVFFEDGVYDFDQGRFREETAADMTTVRLARKFPRVRDNDKIAEVRTKVFNTIFSNAGDIDCFLAHISRSMAGRVKDKQWVVCMSGRNSGKGVICGLNESTWGSYATQINSESFLMDRTPGGDEAKKLSWLLACEHARLIFTNEMRVDTSDSKLRINGNIIKGKLASGGDVLIARKNYKDEVHFLYIYIGSVQGLLFVWCSDLPPITPADAMQTMHKFSFPNEFVAEYSDDIVRRASQRKDEGIKDYCASAEVIDAYT